MLDRSLRGEVYRCFVLSFFCFIGFSGLFFLVLNGFLVFFSGVLVGDVLGL